METERSFDVIDFSTGKKMEELKLSNFGSSINMGLLKEAIEYQENKKRKCLASTKSRGEVRGSGIKMRQQKGSGRSRAGDKRMPHWRGGGVVWGPNDRQYGYSFPKKKFKAAVLVALELKIKEGLFTVVDNLKMEKISTKVFLERSRVLGIDNGIYISDDSNLFLSLRNVPNMDFLRIEGINPLSLLKRKNLVISKTLLEGWNNNRNKKST